MSRISVRYLHRSFAVEIWVVGEHSAEHGDVRSSVGLCQNRIRLGVDRSTRQRLFCQSKCRFAFLRGNKSKLPNEGRIVSALIFNLTKHLGNLPRGSKRRFLLHAFPNEVFADVCTQSLSSLRKMPVE